VLQEGKTGILPKEKIQLTYRKKNNLRSGNKKMNKKLIKLVG
jgi:hypothetical protein